MTRLGFTVDVAQNEYLPEGGSDVNAMVTVTSGRTSASRLRGRRGQRGDHHRRLLGVDGGPADQDRRGPGGYRGGGRRDPRRRGLRGRRGHPATPGRSSRPTAAWRSPTPDQGRGQTGVSGAAAGRRHRHRAVAEPGPADVRRHPAALRHAILLTDGKNRTRRPSSSTRRRPCEGVFSCDCRGVGTDWEVSELRRSPPRCSARSTSCPTRPGWPPTSRP